MGLHTADDPQPGAVVCAAGARGPSAEQIGAQDAAFELEKHCYVLFLTKVRGEGERHSDNEQGQQE